MQVAPGFFWLRTVPQFYAALSGLERYCGVIPGALPRAGLSLPFRQPRRPRASRFDNKHYVSRFTQHATRITHHPSPITPPFSITPSLHHSITPSLHSLMLTQLPNLKARLAILDSDTTNDALLINGIKAVSARFDA